MTTTLSSRELNQDLGRAKKAALDGPVVITDRGRPAHVLLSYADYQRLTDKPRTLLQALSMPGMDGTEGIAFDPPGLRLGLRIPDFDD
jgi:prevent-host-death family protein